MDLIIVDLAIAEVGNVAWMRVVHFQEDLELTDQALQRSIAFILEACDLSPSAAWRKMPFASLWTASEREKAPLMTMDKRLCEKAKGKRDVRMI